MFNSESISTDDQRSLAESNQESNNDQHQIEDLHRSTNSNETIDRIRDGKVPKPDDERKLFVGQLSSDITKEDLESYFLKFGSIEDVTIKYDGPGGRARGFAFILFDKKESIDKVLNVPTHLINQCQIDPKQAHRRPPVTNPVKKIFIGQLPTDFIEQDLSDYFSQFGIVDSIELPMDRGKRVRRPFGFVSFSSEKTAEEVLRQQRHSINGTSIEVRPAKPRPHEQQQYQGHHFQPHHYQQQQQQQLYSVQQTYPFATQAMINLGNNPNSYYPSTMANNNFSAQIIDQYGQGTNNSLSYWTNHQNDPRTTNHPTGNQQWSTGANASLTSINGNTNLYASLANSSSTSIYQQNGPPAMFNPSGVTPQIAYSSSNYSNPVQSSYNLSSSSQTPATIYQTGYSSSSIIPAGDLPTSSSSSTSTWNQYSNAPHLLNGTTNSYEHPNIYYSASFYPNMYPSQYYQAAQQQGISQSQSGLASDQTVSPNGVSTTSNGGVDKNYQHHLR